MNFAFEHEVVRILQSWAMPDALDETERKIIKGWEITRPAGKAAQEAAQMIARKRLTTLGKAMQEIGL